MLAAGAAGYSADAAVVNNTPNDLAGVLLLDTSPVGGTLDRGLAEIPDSIPVYTISAEPGPLDSYGGANDVLVAARRGQFVGVQLVGGVHADAAQSGNPLVQILSQLAGLGSRVRRTSRPFRISPKGGSTIGTTARTPAPTATWARRSTSPPPRAPPMCTSCLRRPRS